MFRVKSLLKSRGDRLARLVCPLRFVSVIFGQRTFVCEVFATWCCVLRDSFKLNPSPPQLRTRIVHGSSHDVLRRACAVGRVAVFVRAPAVRTRVRFEVLIALSRVSRV